MSYTCTYIFRFIYLLIFFLRRVEVINICKLIDMNTEHISIFSIFTLTHECHITNPTCINRTQDFPVMSYSIVL